MKKLVVLAILCLLPALFASAQDEEASTANPRVALDTSKGRIVLELNPEKAPKSVENFLAYVESGHYSGTIFHRVIKGFMVQGGGFTADMAQKETRDPIANESKNGLSNDRGTIAMARTGQPHSATCQFYINHADNSNLNSVGGNWGYAVFGHVVEGMDVVDAIATVPTGFKGRLGDVPKETITIEKASVVE